MAITDGMKLLGMRRQVDQSGLVRTTVPHLFTSLESLKSFSSTEYGTIVGISGVRDEAGNWEAKVHYETSANPATSSSSSSAGNEGPYLTELLDFSMRQEPIQTHGDWATITAAYPYDQYKKEFKELMADGKSRNPLYKTTDFLNYGCTFKKTRVLFTVPLDVFENLGTISTPTFTLIATPINPGWNWLKMAPTVRSRGDAFEVTEEWMLSGTGGWNPDIYSALVLSVLRENN